MGIETNDWYNVRHLDYDNTPLWKRGDGTIIRLDEMSDSYLLNALNFLEIRFFTYFAPQFTDDWKELVRRITKQWPIFEDFVDEALRRKNPWKEDHPECKNLLDAYFKLKRDKHPRAHTSE